jgi:PhnB protein
MTTLCAHLSFPGSCEEAFSFYAQLFGGRASLLAYADTPMAEDVPATWRSKIVHATLSFDGNTLTGADVEAAHYREPQGFALLLDVADEDEARRLFAALAEGGRVEMPLQQTFWSPCFGLVADRFGVPWEINAGQQAPS